MREYLLVMLLMVFAIPQVSSGQSQRDSSLVSAIFWPGTKDEIDILDSQIDRSRNVFHHWSTEIDTELSKAFQDLNAAKKHIDINDVVERLHARLDEQISEIFLPHQMERLRELAYWSEANLHGAVAMLTSDRMKKTLGSSTSRVDEIRKEADALQREFEKEAFELREKYRKKLIERLSKEQRERLKENLGDPARFGQPKIKF
ncbi:MAG: hypothetical protein ABL888_18220 [Pirellulaceae bacterium]